MNRMLCRVWEEHVRGEIITMDVNKSKIISQIKTKSRIIRRDY